MLRPEVVFGRGALTELPAVLERLSARRVLVVSDKTMVDCGAVGRLIDCLDHRVEHVVYDSVLPNPTASVIDAGETVRQKNDCDAILGFGGGSCIDAAKGIGIVATSGGGIATYAGRDKVKTAPLNVVGIPTTAGTGAEVSTAIAATDDVRHTKFAVRADLVPPVAAILDPLELRSLPEKVAAHSAMDALCHCIEAYVSKGASPMTDVLALEGVRRCGASLLAFVRDRADERAAEDMLLAAMLGGWVISHARTGAAHTLTRPMGDRVSHGLANSIVLPYVMEFNLESAPERFGDVANALGGTRDVRSGHQAVVAVQEMIAALGLPKRLRDVGFPEEDLGELADAAYELEISGLNPRHLGRDDIQQLLTDAL